MSVGAKKYFKVLILISAAVIFLAACSFQKGPEEEPRVEMPEVEYKYSDDEIIEFNNRVATEKAARYEGLVIQPGPILREPEKMPSFLFYDSGINIAYPEDGVKGLYLTANNVANEEYFNQIIEYIDETDLNTVVIDFKDDWGNIVPVLDSDNELVQENTAGMVNMEEVLKVLEEKQIYPIARIVTFKDNVMSEAHPEYSFVDTETGELWQDGNGAQFINPFMKETWDYNLAVAEEAAKMGFKEIQFDYIRFPEGFETFSDSLEYDLGGYKDFQTDDPEKIGQERIQAINDFLEYADEYLTPYNVQISADIFGYTAIAGDSPDVRGIGQNFAMMAERVDTVSSMIYPSHWGPSFFGLAYPDLQPYETVNRYIQEEDFLLENVENRPNSRPWLQDFTADYLAPGTYMAYGPAEVQAQINALYENGIREFLLWNAMGDYSRGVDYDPDLKPLTEEERRQRALEQNNQQTIDLNETVTPADPNNPNAPNNPNYPNTQVQPIQ